MNKMTLKALVDCYLYRSHSRGTVDTVKTDLWPFMQVENDTAVIKPVIYACVVTVVR